MSPPDSFLVAGPYSSSQSSTTYRAATGVTPPCISLDSSDRIPVCEAVIPVMTEVTVDGLTGDLSWVATGEVDKAFDVYVVENGTYQVA